MTLSWQAIRNGDRYCAPACGFGCTWQAYEAAVVAAGELVETLGKGWEPRVWENIGWHYAARTPDGRVKVHPAGLRQNGSRSYTAFVSTDDSGGGQWLGRGETPRGALVDVLTKVREDLERIFVTAMVLEDCLP